MNVGLSVTLNDQVMILYINNNVNVSFQLFRINKMLTLREEHNLKCIINCKLRKY